jgi:hypothetical protein
MGKIKRRRNEGEGTKEMGKREMRKSGGEEGKKE